MKCSKACPKVVNDLRVQWRMTAMALVLAAFPYPVDLLWNIFRCIQKTEKSDYYLHHVSSSICRWLSIWMEQLGSHNTDFHEIWYFRIFKKSVHKIHVSLKYDLTCTLHKDLCTFMVGFLLWNVSGKSCRGKNTFYVQYFLFPPKIMPFMS